ncbi:MAG: hypothetical protein GY954_10165, partial [Alteromonas sp.]|nr:hypothetical protein [Alteromonas sp.]
ITVGSAINIALLGQGHAMVYSGPTAPAKIDHVSGYRDITNIENLSNDAGDTGAFIYSRLGCTINVRGL